MKHLISIASLLTVFFWVGSGSIQHLSASSELVFASDENNKLYKEEAQAKTQAKRRYDKFMKIYNKIWSIYGFYHKEFKGTPGNIRYARIAKNYRNYGIKKKALLDIIDKLAGPTDLDAQAKAEGFADRNWQLQLAAGDLNSDIEYRRRKLNELIKEGVEIGSGADAANAAMKKTCQAKTRAQAKPLAEQSIKAASQAISRYKTIRLILPETEKVRDKYIALRSELQSLEAYAIQHRDAYKAMIDLEKTMENDLKDLSYDYLQKKRQRFDELVVELDKFHSQLNRVLYPYTNHYWAETMKDEAHAAGIRVGTITKVISSTEDYGLLNIGETFRDRMGVVSMSDRFDVFIGVGKKLETFFELVSSIQELHKLSKEAAIAARDDAKKALDCAQKLPVDTKPIEKKDCPTGWWQRGGKCCAPEINWWDQGAIREGYRTGRCR